MRVITIRIPLTIADVLFKCILVLYQLGTYIKKSNEVITRN